MKQIKTMCLLIALAMVSVSCQKEYSATAAQPAVNEIQLTVTAETYFTTVNGSSGYYWKITLTASKAIGVSYNALYEFGEAKYTIFHLINANSTAMIAFTQIPAPSQTAKIGVVKLIRVDGAPDYKFTLK